MLLLYKASTEKCKARIRRLSSDSVDLVIYHYVNNLAISTYLAIFSNWPELGNNVLVLAITAKNLRNVEDNSYDVPLSYLMIIFCA